MAFEYRDMLNTVINVLKTYNTTSASPNLAQSLSSGQLDDFSITDHEIDLAPWKNDHYPAIFVRVSNKEDVFESVGATGIGANRVKKRAVVNYEIIGVVQKPGMFYAPALALTEIYNFARNVEAVFRQDFRLTGSSGTSTALWCTPRRTTFGLANVGGVNGTLTKCFVLDLEAVYLFN